MLNKSAMNRNAKPPSDIKDARISSVGNKLMSGLPSSTDLTNSLSGG